jgi:RNA polymerase primary sigma factor
MSKKFLNFDIDDSISQYFKDVRKSVVITLEEEIRLAKKIVEGDEEAVNTLVLANLKFVISIAKEYQGQGLLLNDLINEGNYGLIKAARKFDYTKGFRFISYAVWWVRQSILQSLTDHARTVRLPANVIHKLRKLKDEIGKFEALNEREPIYGEILDAKNKSIELITYPKCSSLNETSGEGGDEFINLLASESEDDGRILIDKRIQNELKSTLDILEPRERDIIECYFGINTACEPMTLEAIGDKYSLSKERIRQIKEKSIRRLRHNSTKLHSIINDY